MKHLPYICIILVLVALLLFQHGCNKKKVAELQSQNTILVMDKNSFKSELNKKGDTIKCQAAGLTFAKSALNVYADSIFALKKKLGTTIAYFRNHVQVRIDSFETAYVRVDTLPVFITDSFARNNMVQVPAYFAADSPYYSIQGAVRKTGVNIYDISISDTMTGRFVENKKGLFRKKTIQYQVMNANPYVQMNGMTSAVYQPKKKGPMGPILVGLVGFAAGLFFAK